MEYAICSALGIALGMWAGYKLGFSSGRSNARLERAMTACAETTRAFMMWHVCSPETCGAHDGCAGIGKYEWQYIKVLVDRRLAARKQP
jgi:hypothetical protein